MNITNKYIAKLLMQMSALMEVANQNPFAIRSYENAASAIRNSQVQLSTLQATELAEMRGIGKSMVGHITEILETGSFTNFENLKALVPISLLELSKIKGLTGKRIQALRSELQIESIEQFQAKLLAGEIATVKGFGVKTSQQLSTALNFYKENLGYIRIDQGQILASQIVNILQAEFKNIDVIPVGAIARKDATLNKLEFLISNSELNILESICSCLESILDQAENGEFYHAEYEILVKFHTCTKSNKGTSLVQLISTQAHLELLGELPQQLTDDRQLYKVLNRPFIIPEMRLGTYEFERMLEIGNDDANIITNQDLLGCLHNHSTYSDGLDSLPSMAQACIDRNLQYFGISDHSKTAAYAGGLKPEKIYEQWEQIAELNRQYQGSFHILAGIESDILANGSLDYDDDILAGFDFIVASVHSKLDMSEAEATKRLLKAIENPYTTMMGHISTRLLLQRPGFPFQVETILDACAANGVMIEINADPERLDIDSSLLYKVLERGIMLSINPDAHSTKSIDKMHWGVSMAMRAGVTVENVLNAQPYQVVKDTLKKKNPAKR
ncbi:MAG: PHP domain-containing protein [Bacteroidota bacterium]|nr:PHP domain-containing protein [Bacteroidota bacterium]